MGLFPIVFSIVIKIIICCYAPAIIRMATIIGNPAGSFLAFLP